MSNTTANREASQSQSTGSPVAASQLPASVDDRVRPDYFARRKADKQSLVSTIHQKVRDSSSGSRIESRAVVRADNERRGRNRNIQRNLDNFYLRFVEEGRGRAGIPRGSVIGVFQVHSNRTITFNIQTVRSVLVSKPSIVASLWNGINRDKSPRSRLKPRGGKSKATPRRRNIYGLMSDDVGKRNVPPHIPLMRNR